MVDISLLFYVIKLPACEYAINDHRHEELKYISNMNAPDNVIF